MHVDVVEVCANRMRAAGDAAGQHRRHQVLVGKQTPLATRRMLFAARPRTRIHSALNGVDARRVVG